MKFIALIALATAIKIEEEGPSATEVFNHVDANDDGKVTWKETVQAGTKYAKKHHIKVTEAQVKEAHKAFKQAAGADGVLTLDELKKALAEHEDVELSESAPSVAEVFDHVDANDDGKVTWKETKAAGLKWAKQQGHKVTKAEIKRAKNMFKNAAGADGVLTLDELKAALAQHEDVELSESEDEQEAFTAKDVLAKCDTDGDKKLDYGEAKACLTAAVENKQMSEKQARRAGNLLLKNAHITKATFVTAAQEDFKQSPEDAVDMFDKIDADGNGFINYKEAKRAVKWAVKNGKLAKKDVAKAKQYLSTKAEIGKAGIARALKKFNKN